MNERFRLLADQAGLRFTQLMSNPMIPVVDGKEAELEKFAQLIVRDCALTAGIMEYEGRAGIGAQLLDNYGVKND